ncbi:MAG: hypothetical protein GY953_18165 [bacterium]|nr:hypothetical protein [bacterium]
MANDDTQRVLASLLEGIVVRSASQQSTEQVLGELAQSLSTAVIAGVDPAARPEPGGETGSRGGSGSETSSGEDQGTSLLARQMVELIRATQSQSDLLQANTQAVLQNSAASSSGGGPSTAAKVGKTVLSYLGGGLGLAQLLGKLFGGSTEETQPVFERYTLPAPVKLEAGLSQSPVPSIYPLSYSADGLPRALPTAPASQPATPVTIQVQAMDSRSFMDHSTEIAQAVREALLHSHSLNDVVMEL